jgi:hypothetical protein
MTHINSTDVSNPKYVSKSHTYFFTGSSSETHSAYVSAIDHNYNVTKYTINIDRRPYTLASAFSGLKLIESKSFLDNDYKEKNLLVLESQSPRFVTYLTLNGKQYNKTSFAY